MKRQLAPDASDARHMQTALALARRGYGYTSPNPMVGAVLVKDGVVIGRGWHKGAGLPHAEIEALRDAAKRRNDVRGATVYVTLEPCSTHGRTPPCTDAIVQAGIARVVAAATDPNPAHRGRGFRLLRKAGVSVTTSVLEREAVRLNEAFNHWIVHGTPFVTVKAAMTLDGKIATAGGDSKWITSERARALGMRLRLGADAILVGVNTILADNPALTYRGPRRQASQLRRIVLDSDARVPLDARVISDDHAPLTTIVVSRKAPQKRVSALAQRVEVWAAPATRTGLDLRWVLKKLAADNVVNLLVEGGGEMNASFLNGGLAHRVVFFYAPKILGGRNARKAAGGKGVQKLKDALRLIDPEWRRIGPDLILSARIAQRASARAARTKSA